MLSSYLEFWMMNNVEKPSDSVCYIYIYHSQNPLDFNPIDMQYPEIYLPSFIKNDLVIPLVSLPV
jgi:hypothetical protein